MSSHIAVILYGAPGSGKGTQANLLAAKRGLIHFDTGRHLESIVHDPRRQGEAVVRRERDLFDRGVLLTPSFVLRETSKQVRRLGKTGWGLVLSGSPRSIVEAQGLLPILDKTYGKQSVFVVVLDVVAETSIKRNSERLICKMCGSPVLLAYYPTRKPLHCPLCGGPLYRRVLDNRKTMLVRIQQYRLRTEPIFAFMRGRGYAVHRVAAGSAPYKVFQNVTRIIDARGAQRKRAN